MRKLIITGGKTLKGDITISGAKNVALKLLVAACLTSDTVTISNIPLISDLEVMLDLIRSIGGDVRIVDHTVTIQVKTINNVQLPLDIGAKIRTSSMFLAPLLARAGKAIIPNPGGCRIGARPIDRHIAGLEKMNAVINYDSQDGFFHATTTGLTGVEYTFEKNTHTGTETLILAAVLANGRTILHNAALEPEVDELIAFLNKMGAKVVRYEKSIIIDGVQALHGANHEIVSDSNETVTFAVMSALTGGSIWIKNFNDSMLSTFLETFKRAGGSWEKTDNGVRFYFENDIKPVDITTSAHPGFKTDWQSTWAVIMTQANGQSVIHETVYEDRFGYVKELIKMGTKINFFNPPITDPENFYNFNYNEVDDQQKHAIKIFGKTNLHNAVVKISDLRAGATLVIAALIASGQSIIFGAEILERGYEAIDIRLRKLGADIRIEEE